MTEQEMFEAMDAANKAHHEQEEQQQKLDAGILQAVKAMVTVEVFAEIECELGESESVGQYQIIDTPVGQPQDNEFSLGDVYVDQHCGVCEDDFYGTVALPLPDGRYFQFSFHC